MPQLKQAEKILTKGTILRQNYHFGEAQFKEEKKSIEHFRFLENGIDSNSTFQNHPIKFQTKMTITLRSIHTTRHQIRPEAKSRWPKSLVLSHFSP